MFHKVFMFSLVGLSWCTGQNPTIYLNIVESASVLTCEDTAATVLEGDSLKIEVKNYEHNIYNITCATWWNPTMETGNKSIDIYQIYPIMGAVWNCRILTIWRLEFSQLQQTQSCGSDTCAAIECRIKMHVRRKEAPQVILVNNMVLQSERAQLREAHDALAVYTFNDGDLVDVTCAIPIQAATSLTCHLQIDYDYVKHWGVPDTMLNSSNIYRVGFRLRMRAGNDNTHAICTCGLWPDSRAVPDDISTVRVNFHMRREPIANPINVYINDAALRPTTDTNSELEYQYKTSEDLHVTCENELGDSVQFAWITSPNRKDIYKVQALNEKVVTLYLKLSDNNDYETFAFQCKTSKDNIIVRLKPRHLYEANYECSLRAELQHLNTIVQPSLELYRLRNQYFIYEYEDDDTFYLTCTASCLRDDYEINLLGTGPDTRSYTYSPTVDSTMSIYKYIKKSEIDKDNVFRCWIKEKYTDGPVLVATLVFVHGVTPTRSTKTNSRIPITTGTPTTVSSDPGDKESGNRWLLPAVGGVACMVVVCVIVVGYKMRSRKNDRRNQLRQQPIEDNYENLNGNSPIPPFPSQWESHYAEPMCKTADTIYCEPCTGPRADTLHTSPVQKARRKPANIQTTDPTYEDINLGQPKVVQNATDHLNYVEITHNESDEHSRVQPKKLNGNHETPNYAQVVPKSLRGKQVQGASSGKYANVHDERRYVNANTGSEYAEPAYCEPAYIDSNK